MRMTKKQLTKDIYLQKKDRIINYNSIIMEYQKIISLLDNTANQSTKFGTKVWVEINDELRGQNVKVKFM